MGFDECIVSYVLPYIFGRIHQWNHLSLLLLFFGTLLMTNFTSLIVQFYLGDLCLFVWIVGVCVLQGIRLFKLSYQICGHRVVYSILLLSFWRLQHNSDYLSFLIVVMYLLFFFLFSLDIDFSIIVTFSKEKHTHTHTLFVLFTSTLISNFQFYWLMFHFLLFILFY